MDCHWYRYDTFKKNWHHLPKEYIYFDFGTLNFNTMKILITGNKKEKKGIVNAYSNFYKVKSK